MSIFERDRPTASALTSCGDPIVDSVRAKLHNPDIGDDICLAVAIKLGKRSEVGQAKYGTKLTSTDLSQLEWLIHAQEEAMDLANYLEVLIQRANPWSTIFDTLQEQALAAATELEGLIQHHTRQLS